MENNNNASDMEKKLAKPCHTESLLIDPSILELC